MRCHRSGAANAIRSACRHAPDPGTPVSGGLRGVIPRPARSTVALIARRAVPGARVLATQHVTEPATDPPRAPLA